MTLQIAASSMLAWPTELCARMPAADGSIRRAVRDRLLGEMLGSVNDPIGGGWKVLVLDEVTTRIMSSAVKMSDILDTGGCAIEGQVEGTAWCYEELVDK